MIIGDAAPAFRRLAPMPSQKRRRTRWSHRCERSGHRRSCAKLTCIASHGSGRRALRVSATYRRLRRQGLCHRWGRGYRYRLAARGARTLMRACALRGGNRHRASTRGCALRCLGLVLGIGAWRAAVLGFHGLQLHRLGTADAAVGASCSWATIGCEATPIASGVAALMRYAA